MEIYLYFLTLVLGMACLGIVKKKLYKDKPFICLMIFIGFIGCGISSFVYSFVPFGVLLVMPITSIVFGLIFILMAVNDIYSLICCREKVDGVYCGYKSYYGGYGISTQAPVFEYTYNGTYYHEQSMQTVSYKRLNKSMTEGNVYSIYIDPKHPSVFILCKKITIVTIIEIVFGLMFFISGIDFFLPLLFDR